MAALATLPASALAAPAVTFTSGPAEGSRTNQTMLELEFSAAGDIAEYRCSVDDQPAESCWENLWLSELTDGEHVVSITARDAEDVTSDPAVRRFTVDATGPAPTLAPVPETLAAGPIALRGTAGTAAFDDGTVDVLVVPYVEGMQHSLDPVVTLKVPVVDGTWAATTPAVAAGSYVVAVEQFDDLWNSGHASRRVTVVAPPAAPTPAPVQAAAAPATPAAPASPAAADPKSALTQTARGLTQALGKGGIDGLLKKPTVAPFQAPGAGTVTVQYLAPRAKGAKGPKGPKTVVVARGTRTVGAAGKADVTVKLTKAGRAALKQGKRVKLTVKTSFTAKGAKKAQTSSSTVTLKKKGK